MKVKQLEVYPVWLVIYLSVTAFFWGGAFGAMFGAIASVIIHGTIGMVAS